VSILPQLTYLAEQRGLDYNTAVFRYLVERTLYRLGVAHPDTFVLKGGLFMGLLAYVPYRATKDTDLTAFGNWSEDRLKQAFGRLMFDNPCPEDGVTYTGKVRSQIISAGRHYQGTRIRIKAHVEHESRKLSFDISHGSALAQPPLPWSFGSLVPGLPEPAEIRVYPVETVLAEKIHAFHVYPDPATFPRTRDLYDLAFLLTTTELAGEEVARAVERTFKVRLPTREDGSVFWPNRPASLTELHLWEEAQQAWAALLPEDSWFQPTLAEAILVVELFASPLLDALYEDRAFKGTWSPGGPWRITTE
jgi:predicted nucleotidyltransferase component of viral defense system